jgi:hypothetical protein
MEVPLVLVVFTLVVWVVVEVEWTWVDGKGGAREGAGYETESVKKVNEDRDCGHAPGRI